MTAAAPAPADSDRLPLLMVPGGSARRKAEALGTVGRAALRDHLSQGGRYMGFCGGAGLALSHADADEGLNICPWSRAGYTQRLHHLISGHVRAVLPAADRSTHTAERSLPVWWPGRFAFDPLHPEVTVLASYAAPDEDFWIADLPLRSIASHVFETWRDLYGVDLSADFLTGQPLAVRGAYGGGAYILSYSHLETPDSPAANAWLAELLRDWAGLAPTSNAVPLWDLRTIPAPAFDGPLSDILADALRKMRSLLDLAVEHSLFFERTPWLYGWRAGLPGAACNNLHAALHTAAGLSPSPAAAAYCRQIAPCFAELMRLFHTGAEGYLLACRLTQTLSPFLPDAVDAHGLNTQRDMLFGRAMSGGGMVEELLTMTEEIIYLSQEADQND